MMLRLTAKALALLGNERATLTTSQADDEDWYLNLVWVDGRKCLLLTHGSGLHGAPIGWHPANVACLNIRKPRTTVFCASTIVCI